MIRMAGLPECDHFTKNSALLIGFFFCYGAPCWIVWSFSISPCQILLPSAFLFQMFNLHCTLKGSSAIFGPLVLSSIDNTLDKPLTFLTLILLFASLKEPTDIALFQKDFTLLLLEFLLAELNFFMLSFLFFIFPSFLKTVFTGYRI